MMSGFSFIKLVLGKTSTQFVLESKSQWGFQTSLFKIRFFSSEICPKSNDQSLTVSFLINSCGLSLESAKSVSEKVHFKTLEKPESVLSLLRDHGFTPSHISKIVKAFPNLLTFRAEETLLPKLEFLSSIGASSSDLCVILYKNPKLLIWSLERNLIPCYNVLKSVLLSDENVIRCFKRMRSYVSYFPYKNLVANLCVLRELGVNQSIIVYLLLFSPNITYVNVDKFNEYVKKVTEIGIDPSKPVFAIALNVCSQLSPQTWQSKMEAYERWGLSPDEILSAFRKQPNCMKFSEEKIMISMDFFVNKMNLQPKDVARVPVVISYSLEKRIVPRCSVIRILQLKGLMKRKVSISSVLVTSEKHFMDLFVSKHKELEPQLLDIFRGKTNLEELGFGFDEIVKVGLGH